MKKVVFTIKDDVCAANNRDVNATNLLEKMKLYGSVEDYDTVVADMKREYQKSLDSLNAQYEAIKSQNLTDDEIKLINTYRACKAEIQKTYEAQISVLTKQLQDIKEESERRLEQIRAIVG